MRVAAVPLLLCALQSIAQQTAAPPRNLATILVTGTRPPPDEVIVRQVNAALASDRYILAEHVTVTLENGVATLHGIALDYWDVARMKRLARRVPGVKRVVDDLDVRLGGD